MKILTAVRYRIRCNFGARRITENIQTVYSQVNYFYFFLFGASEFFLNIFLSFIILSIVSQSQIHADTFWRIGGNDAELGIGSPCG